MLPKPTAARWDFKSGLFATSNSNSTTPASSEFEANIGDFKEVQSCYHIAGAFDYLIAVDVPDMDAYHEFISHKLAAMDNIGTVQSSFVMSEVLEL